MIGFGALVRLFVRDLVRRRLLWGLIIVVIGIAAVNYWTTSTMMNAMARGESYDIATRRAARNLEQLASLLRLWVYVAVILLGAQVAPESRKNGTTQFVLSLGVRRDVLAGAQFCALAILISIGVILLHGGFAIAGLRAEAMTVGEAALSWTVLLPPLLLAAAAVFAMSLASSSIETYLLFFGVPFVTEVLPNTLRGVTQNLPLLAARAMDNISLLVPWFADLTPWPHVAFPATRAPPHPEWRWYAAHVVCAATFWIFVGLWRHRHHDFGSRAAVK